MYVRTLVDTVEMAYCRSEDQQCWQSECLNEKVQYTSVDTRYCIDVHTYVCMYVRMYVHKLII